MENLIDSIKEIFNHSELYNPIVDLRFDKHNKVVGYVADKLFAEKDPQEAQQLIWKTLKERLHAEDFLQVALILPESIAERAERLITSVTEEIPRAQYWQHETPDLTRYWLFLDVEKCAENYQAFFLIINVQKNFTKRIIFNYTQELIAFMELADDEIEQELYTYVFRQAESEIKQHLMTEYDNLSKHGIYGKNNIFYYVFENFRMKPLLKKQLLLNTKEIELLTKMLAAISQFKLKAELELIIKQSQLMLENSVTLCI